MVEIRETVARKNVAVRELVFDDMLSRLDDALRGEKRRSAGQRHSSAFPVAMIDEFQDTDPQSTGIFRRSGSAAETALLLIGDPKQAIWYASAARIFSPMKSAWRCGGSLYAGYQLAFCSGMVESVNRLFSLSDNPFMFREIPFPCRSKPAEENHRLRFTVDNDATGHEHLADAGRGGGIR